MRLYAELPGRRARQLLGDLFVAVWTAGALATGTTVGLALARVGDRTAALARQTRAAATDLHSSADSVAGVPFAGSRLASPLRSFGDRLGGLGHGLDGDTATLHRAGLLFGLAFAVLGVAVPVLAWCLTRGRWVRRVASLTGHLSEDDLEILACTAAAGAGLAALRRLPPGLVLAWRAGDPVARRAVAGVGLRTLGMRPLP